jgi:carbamoyltransferase
MVNILGISAYYHDSAACLVRDGELIAAAQEERFTRKKHDEEFPHHAVAYCLREGGLRMEDLDYVGFYDKPLLKFERILENYLGVAPRDWARSSRRCRVAEGETSSPATRSGASSAATRQAPLRRAPRVARGRAPFIRRRSTKLPSSPWTASAEWATSSYGVGRGKIDLLASSAAAPSLGMLYSAFTYYTGFKVNSGEYKVMGLAPYGEPRFVDTIMHDVLQLKEDGSFKLNMDLFNYLHGLTMTNGAFDKLFGGPPRKPESELTQREMDLAASVQVVTEEIMLRMARHVQRETGMENLCLAGGVALNCVGNGRLLREGPFEEIYILPAPGDAGGAARRRARDLPQGARQRAPPARRAARTR